MSAAITFDFHNTLVRCDRWFELETRDLPAVVSRAMSGHIPPVDISALTLAYRGLRKEIIEHGRELDAVEGVQEAFGRVGIAVDPAMIRPSIDEVMAKVVDKAELLPGVPSTLQLLWSNNIPLGVVSSAVHHQFVEWALDRLGVHKYFRTIVTSAMVGYYKSRPEIYRFALETLGAVAERSVHVGDSYQFDHLAGQGVGLATVWLNEPSALQSIDGIPPDLELSTLEGAGPDLLRLFRSRQGLIDAD